MEVSAKIFKFLACALALALLGIVVWGAIARHSYEKELASLRNEVASKSQTIETQKQVYTKLAQESKKLQDLVDTQNSEVRRLQDQLNKQGEDLLTANQLVVKWKKAYEGKANSGQVDIPDPGNPSIVRKKVEFNRDFGMIGVTGWTLTDPPEAWVKVEQLKPLEITLVVSQDADKKWHTYATSSDENTAVDIKLASVNPHVLEPRWYEKIQLNTNLGVGGDGALVGLGVSYQIKQFDLGPAVFFTATDRVERYIGLSFGWRPFQRVR